MATRPNTGTFVGIDVAKDRLDAALRPGGHTWTEPNDPVGHRRLAQRLKDAGVSLVVLEATGGYEHAPAAALAAGGLPVAVVNPRQVRDFAKATGQLAKTDALDAGVLALFAERVRPEVRPLSSEAQRALEGLLARRRQLVGMLVSEKNRLDLAEGGLSGAYGSTSAGSSGNSARSRRRSSKPLRQAPRGRPGRSSSRACPASAACWPGRSWPSYRSWDTSTGRRSRSSSGRPRSTATAGGCAGERGRGAVALTYGPSSTWRRSRQRGATPPSASSTRDFGRRGSHRRWRSWPRCGSCS